MECASSENFSIFSKCYANKVKKSILTDPLNYMQGSLDLHICRSYMCIGKSECMNPKIQLHIINFESFPPIIKQKSH